MPFGRPKQSKNDIVLDNIFSADFLKGLSLQSILSHARHFLRFVPAEHWERVRAIRPWAVFFDAARFSLPSFAEATRRIGVNLVYFASNYCVVSLVIAFYQILCHPLLLVAMFGCACFAAYYRSLAAEGHRLVLGGEAIPDSKVYGCISGTAVFLFWVTGGTSAVFWIVSLCAVAIGAHGALRDVEDTEMLVRHMEMANPRVVQTDTPV